MTVSLNEKNCPVNVVQPTSSQRQSGAFLTHYLAGSAKVFNTDKAQWQHCAHEHKREATLTVVAPALTLSMLEQLVAGISTSLDCSAISCHAMHQRFGDSVITVDVAIRDRDRARASLGALADTFQVELALQQQRPRLSQPGLLVMDMDSTLIAMECIDEIARLGDVGDQVASVTRKAMRGELDFRESLLTRVACLEGIAESRLQAIRDGIPVMPGAALLVQVLQQHNWKVAVASGGFTYFADHLAQRLDLDFAVSNVLETRDGKLTGKIIGDIVDAQRKAQTVRELAEKWQIDERQTVAMGDGANDLVMMDAAALGVACHAKPAVVEKADVSIVRGGLHTLLYLLG